MSYKHLVVGGCSFSESHHPWAYELGINRQNVSNLARGGCGNEFIRRQIIHGVSELLERGIPSNEILVGAQWTGTARIDLFVTKEETVTENKFHTDFQIDNLGHQTHPANSGSVEWDWNNDKHDYGWIHSGGGNNFVTEWETKDIQDRFFQNYFKYFMTHDIAWNNFLNNVLTLQWFCQSNNISYFNFTGWNNVQNDNGMTYETPRIEEYSHSKHLWNRVEQNNFIFIESGICNITPNIAKNDKVSPYGGMWQYLAKHGGINWDNDHPSDDGQIIWGNFLSKELKDRKII